MLVVGSFCADAELARAVARAGSTSPGVEIRACSDLRELLDDIDDFYALITDQPDIVEPLPTLRLGHYGYDEYVPSYSFYVDVDEALPLGRCLGRCNVEDDDSVERYVALFLDLARHIRFETQGEGLTNDEVVALDDVVRAIHVAVRSGALTQEASGIVLAAAETIEAQQRSPFPDRQIVGISLRAIIEFGGGLATGVAANYLTLLLQHFMAR